jgi:hypothetical protein
MKPGLPRFLSETEDIMASTSWLEFEGWWRSTRKDIDIVCLGFNRTQKDMKRE